MQYIVTSSKKVCGKINGEKLTESDILTAGGNVEHLLAAGHIGKELKTPTVKEAPPEVKEVLEVPQVFNTLVFNSQEIGDK